MRFIVGQKIPEVPYIVREWLKTHSGQQPPDGLILTQPWSRGPAGAAVTETIYYQYRASRARRTLRGISEQVSKAERVVAGKIPVKRNRFITLTGAQKSVNRDLEAKAKALAGWKGYITNLADPRPEYVIGAYHQLWQIEKSFRMSKSDLKARPIHHHLKDSIEAHLTIVFAALAVARWLEATTKVSLKTLVKTLRRYRTIDIQAGDAIVTAEDPIPDNTQTWLDAIHNTQERHQMNQVRFESQAPRPTGTWRVGHLPICALSATWPRREGASSSASRPPSLPRPASASRSANAARVRSCLRIISRSPQASRYLRVFPSTRPMGGIHNAATNWLRDPVIVSTL